MKRSYTKPSLVVEPLSLDMPSARGCDYRSEDYRQLMEFGYFTGDMSCVFSTDEIEWGDNTICLNTNIITALNS